MALTRAQKSLKDWGKQKWRTKSGKKSSAEYSATSKAKRAAKKKGKQFSKQPKAIAKKTKRYR